MANHTFHPSILRAYDIRGITNGGDRRLPATANDAGGGVQTPELHQGYVFRPHHLQLKPYLELIDSSQEIHRKSSVTHSQAHLH